MECKYISMLRNHLPKNYPLCKSQVAYLSSRQENYFFFKHIKLIISHNINPIGNYFIVKLGDSL